MLTSGWIYSAPKLIRRVVRRGWQGRLARVFIGGLGGVATSSSLFYLRERRQEQEVAGARASVTRRLCQKAQNAYAQPGRFAPDLESLIDQTTLGWKGTRGAANRWIGARAVVAANKSLDRMGWDSWDRCTCTAGWQLDESTTRV